MSKRLNNPIHRNIKYIHRKQGITFVKALHLCIRKRDETQLK